MGLRQVKHHLHVTGLLSGRGRASNRSVLPKLFPKPRHLYDLYFHFNFMWTAVLATYNCMVGALVHTWSSYTLLISLLYFCLEEGSPRAKVSLKPESQWYWGMSLASVGVESSDGWMRGPSGSLKLKHSVPFQDLSHPSRTSEEGFTSTSGEVF